MALKTITYTIDDGLPDWATPESLKALHDGGKSLRELASMTGVSKEKVRQLIKKAKNETPDS